MHEPASGGSGAIILAIVMAMLVLGPVNSYRQGVPIIVERTISLTTIQVDYIESRNTTSINGIKHTKGLGGVDRFYEFDVQGKYHLEEGITYYLRIRTTSQKDMDESLKELTLIVEKVW